MSDAGRRAPTAEDAARILSTVTGQPVAQIARFPSGLAHYVYDGRLVDDRQLVVRLTRPDSRADFAGAVYWSQTLKPLGVPLPELYYVDIDGHTDGFPVLIMERLPGTDLGAVYPLLSGAQKLHIARQIVALHRRVTKLPRGAGFGYGFSFDDPSLKHTWKDVVEASLERSRRRILAAGLVSVEVVERVQEAVDRFGDYLSTVAPTCFLHDTTTKNVIVDGGQLSGIVDVDSMCFGDPLFTPALTRMALLSSAYDAVYVDAWTAELELTPLQQRALTLYTAVFCVNFLAELGHAFNRETAEPVQPQRVRHLLMTLADLLAEAGRGLGGEHL